MTKGKYGLSLVAVAILAFVLAFFGLLEALILFLAFALILEKDQWLSRQVFQAFYLRLAYVIVLTVVGWVFTAINAFFGLFDAYRVINFFSGVHNVIRFLLHVGLFVLALIAVLRLAKGKEAGLPVISGLVDKTFGLFAPKAKPQPQPQQAYTAPPPAAPYQPPVAQAAPPPPPPPPPPAPPSPPPVPAPVPQTATEPVAAEPLPAAEKAQEPSTPSKPAGTWTCSCGRENNGNFCMSCGKPRPT